MNSIGTIFRATREKKKITTSQAAAATRMKIQHVEAIESDDYDKFAAPTYARGFIKLYAEYLGLDPTAYIKQYNDHFQTGKRPSLMPDDSPSPSVPARPPPKVKPRPAVAVLPEGDEEELSPLPEEAPAPAAKPRRPPLPRPDIGRWVEAIKSHAVNAAKSVLSADPVIWKRVGLAVALVLLIWFVPHLARRSGESAGRMIVSGPQEKPKSMSNILRDPPEPYMQTPGSP